MCDQRLDLEQLPGEAPENARDRVIAAKGRGP
jgi:hypothetical protein